MCFDDCQESITSREKNWSLKPTRQLHNFRTGSGWGYIVQLADVKVAGEQCKSSVRGPLSPKRRGPYHTGQVDDCVQQVADSRQTKQWESSLAPR